MLAKVFSAGLIGIDAYPIEIEVDVSFGLPKEVVVGLPDAAVKESKDRVRSALCNSGFSYPEDKVTVDLDEVHWLVPRLFPASLTRHKRMGEHRRERRA